MFQQATGKRNSNMCQCSLNTFDSCPTGKFRVRARTERVNDQVAMNETRPALSSRLEWACLTGRRKGRKNGKDRHEEERNRAERGRVNMTGREKKRDEVAG